MSDNGGNEFGKTVATETPAVNKQRTKTMPNDPLIGKVVDGRYQIESVLGEGGMGIVYRSVHTTLGKHLAIKVLRAEVSKNEEILARFKQEAQSASAIGNQHIIDISDFGVLPDGSTYFVMEFLSGVNLTEALQGGRFPTARTIKIAKQLCNALGAAHEIGVVHRDMKPDNVQLISRGEEKDFVKVLDFGIAKVGGSNSKLTQAGQVFGTPHYMSPEQCAGTTVDQRTDIYALGVILYEMATGQVPFDADNLMGILTKHLYENPVPPREFEPPIDVPPALEAVIMKALAKKPENRYQSMAEMAADLDAVSVGTTPKAVVEAVNRSTRASSPQSGASPSVRIGMPSQEIVIKKSNLPIFIVLGAIVVIAGGIGTFLMGSKGESAPESPNVVKPAEPKPLQTPEKETAKVVEQQKAPEPKIVQEQEKPKIKLTTVPETVEVYIDGLLVGNTPYTVTKPEGKNVVDLVLRKAEYNDKKVRVSSRTSENMVVTLDKKVVPVRPRTTTRKAREPARTEPKATRPARTRPPSEVLDPWD
ncbi:MAG: protein kinase [Deltaproteobacteria bacterium]|nr:protein kinase [Deltaproteobacteria bacterium]